MLGGVRLPTSRSAQAHKGGHPHCVFVAVLKEMMHLLLDLLWTVLF